MKRMLFFTFILLMSASCNTQNKTAENPFFSAWETPYGVPPFDKIRPEHFMPAFERAMSLHDAEIDAIVSNHDEPTFENVIAAYDRSGRMLEQVGLVFGMLCEAESSEQLRALQEQAMPLLTAHDDKIGMNERLSPRSRRSTTAVPNSGWEPTKPACWKRPTARSSARARCSARKRKRGSRPSTKNWPSCR